MDEMNAKKNVLRSLIKDMRNEMGSPLKQKFKKVTVMSDTDEGIKKGLNKAEQIMEKFRQAKGDNNPYHSLDKGGPEISDEGEQVSDEALSPEILERLGEQEESLEDSVDEELLKKLLKR